MLQPRLTFHPHGITAVDTEYVRPEMDAAHLIVHRGRAAFVDTGTSHSVPLLLAALRQLGIPPDAVDYVFLTHVHLDHAGGAGALMQALPHARAVLHPRGAAHMSDPQKLIAAAMAVYGEAQYRELYGDIVPIAAARILTLADGQRLDLAGREFEFVHTPGHALHHQAIIDHGGDGIFTGDTFGLSYREFDTERGAFIVPTTTPTQFDPEQLIASIRRLMSYAPQAMYLTHYSRVTDTPRLARQLELQIQEFACMAREHARAPDAATRIHAQMRALWLRLAREHGWNEPEARFDAILGKDLELNTQGLIAWVQRAQPTAGQTAKAR